MNTPRSPLAAIGSLVLFAGLAAAPLPTASAQDAVTRVSTAGASALAEQATPLSIGLLDVVARSKDLGPVDPQTPVHLVVSLKYGDEAGMQAFVDRVSDPKSPEYRNFITPEQVGERFGLPAERVQSVVDHLKGAGLTITLVAKNRLAIMAEGTIEQAERAFGTSIRSYQVMNADEPGSSEYRAPSTVLSVPAAIAPLIVDVEGLETFTRPQKRILNPTQTRSLYNVAPVYAGGSRGLGRTVGISNWDGFRLTNVPLFYTAYGLPAPAGGVNSNITVITSGGGSGTGTAGGEGDLDIQMVLSAAPQCTLRIYDGAGTGGPTGVLTLEVNDNLCDVISESYGWSLSSSAATSAHNLHLSMSAQGITYMAASGDSGTTLEPYSYPNYEPEVLQVGGTIAAVNGSGGRASEVGWSGSGGGWSTNTAAFNTRPVWQRSGTGVPAYVAGSANDKRLGPDVALNAAGSGSGAYYFYQNGGLVTTASGTSFACPVLAGSLADAEQQIIANGGLAANAAGKRRFGRIQDLFYSQNGRSDVWYDVTSGSNGRLPGSTTNDAAGPGWDFVTGWGALNIAAFVNVIAPPCAAPSITTPPASVTVCPGDPAAFSIAASGTSLSYRWRRGTTNLSDGGNVSGATTSSLLLTNVSAADADANYNCVVTSSCGTPASAGASLTVGVAPTITVQPPPILQVCPDGTASLSVSTSISSGLTYQWQVQTAPDTWQALGNDPAPVLCGGAGGMGTAFATPFNTPNVSIGLRRCAGSGPTDVQRFQLRCVVSNACGSDTSAQTTYTICPGDFDCSGGRDIDDIFVYLNAWFANDPRSDIDQSGARTIDDIFIFLSAWFAGC